jgi:alcohol dehydrogenase (NADP+)
MRSVRFTNNDTIDCIGLGTWKATGKEVKDAMSKAIKAGIRHIDTASIYGNETEIGEILVELFSIGKLKREDLFITSKLWNDSHHKTSVIPALKESLKKLQLDYLDLYLIHWPVATKKGVVFPSEPPDYIPLDQLPIIETWVQMEKAKELGLASHIGVSNFSKQKLKDLVSKAKIKPEMNQIELHPLLQQNELVNFCRDENILITAYSPMGSRDRNPAMKASDEPDLFELQVIKDIALKHHCTPAQVLLAWHCERGTTVIPKSTSKKNIKLNFNAGSLQLDKEDMRDIATLDRHYRFINGKFFDMPERGYINIFDD